jgi:hypothetical protein
VIIEPSRWLGGMTGGGLSHIDWGRKEAVGGMARKILKDGGDDAHYRSRFLDLVREHGIEVVFEHRLADVQLADAKIESMMLDHAPPDPMGCPVATPTKPHDRTVRARVFIDCSYEGDLMAKAGVSYSFGRESREQYGESLAGVRPTMAAYEVDPYLRPGDPKSGLLPLLQNIEMGPLGSADKLTMGYGFRWKFAFEGDRLPLDPPAEHVLETPPALRGVLPVVDLVDDDTERPKSVLPLRLTQEAAQALGSGKKKMRFEPVHLLSVGERGVPCARLLPNALGLRKTLVQGFKRRSQVTIDIAIEAAQWRDINDVGGILDLVS